MKIKLLLPSILFLFTILGIIVFTAHTIIASNLNPHSSVGINDSKINIYPEFNDGFYQSGPKDKVKPVLVYPNPFKRFLYIDLNNINASENKVSVEVYDILGKLHHEGEYRFGNVESFLKIDLDLLPPGVYFVYLLTHERRAYKIIKDQASNNNHTPNNAESRPVT